MLKLYSRIFWIFSFLSILISLHFFILKKVVVIEWNLLNLNSLSLKIPLFLDSIRCIFLLTVLFISANVLKFASIYMEDEVILKRFTYLVRLFIASIATLIFIPNVLALLLGWDGLGLVSFLLVAFYASPKALGAGILTALRNRIGDAFLIISIALIPQFVGHFGPLSLLDQPYTALILILAAITKRAQFPFSGWLPAAIEAPTPVSALVHSSTLVTAGIYLMIRLYPLLSQSKLFCPAILFIGAITSLFAGLRALAEYDLKKIIALSTLSQLGFIRIRIGVKAPNLALFHLITHAMLKALLLICAGILIHLHHHSQDIRAMGRLIKGLPLVACSTIISSLSLCALPFISGLYSKDAILQILFLGPSNYIAILVTISATLITRIYSGRLFYLALASSQKITPIVRLKEVIFQPIATLRIGAIVAGSLIASTIGPMSLEPFNPISKFILTAIFRVGLFFIPMIISKGKLNSFDPLISFYSAASYIFYLVPLTTQKLLKISISLIVNSSKSDQSWLELGKTETWKSYAGRNSPRLVMVAMLAIIILIIAY